MTDREPVQYRRGDTVFLNERIKDYMKRFKPGTRAIFLNLSQGSSDWYVVRIDGESYSDTLPHWAVSPPTALDLLVEELGD